MAKRNPGCDCGEEGICNETLLTSSCCRCVPRRLCVFLEMSEGCGCSTTSTLLEINSDGEYTGEISCGDEVIDLVVYIEADGALCYWKVLSDNYEINEQFEIDGYMQQCESPDLLINIELDDCSGTLTILRHDVSILEPSTDGCEQEPWCGTCECVCEKLCLIRSDIYQKTLKELEWNPLTHSWEGDDETVTLTRDSETGECLVTVDGYDPVRISECAESLVFQASKSLYEWVMVRCATCSCEICQGCCFPVNYYPGFGWYPEVLPFSINAPSCAQASSFSSVFSSRGMGDLAPCGLCAYFEAANRLEISASGWTAAPPNCIPTPVPIPLCFALECENNASVDPEDCCGRLRLVVGSIYPFAGWKRDSFFSFCEYTIRIAASSCDCDEQGGLSAIFPLDALTLDCSATIPSGPCAGRPVCPVPTNCSFQGATLII